MRIFQNHWLLFHITIVETTVSGKRGMNPVEITISVPRKEYCPSRESNQRPPALTSCTLPTETTRARPYTLKTVRLNDTSCWEIRDKLTIGQAGPKTKGGYYRILCTNYNTYDLFSMVINLIRSPFSWTSVRFQTVFV